MNVRRPKAPGATLMSKMYPHPQCHSARLRRLGYVPPIWHRALRRAPPKDLYPLKRLKGNLKLPGDKVVKKVFQRIPMLRKERYEHFNVDYQPLATRIALTQMRLQREGMTEDDAFHKCERDIFKEELYFFAKGIRDNPGNHFKLTHDELRSFYLHDLINEAQFLKQKVAKAINTVDTDPNAAIQTDPASSAKKQVTDRIAQDTVAQYLVDVDPVFEDVLKERKFKKVHVNPFHHPYKLTGEYNVPKSTYLFQPDFNVDDIILYRHATRSQENQRFLRSQVQVAASAFLDAVEFGNKTVNFEGLEPENDNDFDSRLLTKAGGHLAKSNKDFFTIQEGLQNRELSRDETELDKQIAVMLLKQDKATAKAEKKAAQANKH
jgi:hypothetical protein